LLLLLLLPALAPAISALLPVATFPLAAAIGRQGVSGAHCEGGSCEAVGQVDLGADRVGEVRYYKDVLDVCVAGNG
jgi:hypothetical protein